MQENEEEEEDEEERRGKRREGMYIIQISRKHACIHGWACMHTWAEHMHEARDSPVEDMHACMCAHTCMKTWARASRTCMHSAPNAYMGNTHA
jgi:hypothetical protein